MLGNGVTLAIGRWKYEKGKQHLPSQRWFINEMGSIDIKIGYGCRYSNRCGEGWDREEETYW